MLKKYACLLVFLFPLVLAAQVEFDEDAPKPPVNAYRCTVDLTDVHNDKLKVIISLPKTDNRTAEFRMPSMVPGTYSVYNFGRFISNFTAFDSKGAMLRVEKTDVNGWEIKNASDLKTIVYEVEDTWDTPIKDNFIFEPAGTNIDSCKNYIINTFGFFGYLKDKRDIPYELYITKPIGFYASTGTDNLISGPKNDVLKFNNYNDLADSPIMYCVPDTTWLNVGGAKVLVSVFSPNKKATSKDVSKNIFQILDAQRQYLGGTLPVKKYAFIINLFTGFFSRSGSYGALEHSYSSFYFLPEMSGERLSQTVKDISAHEFFHIVTPLNIHSEEIQHFDYDNPKMSAHLWLYEGLTEYSATLVQIKYGLMDMEDYLDVLLDKTKNAASYNDSLPFTTMSLGVLDKYAEQYGNVYEKGALIGLCLDIKLRSLSKGTYGIQNLMVDLAKKYGKDKPFKDDDLFDEITKLTYPEIGTFLKECVGGTTPLPVAEVLELVGIKYEKDAKKDITLVGNFSIYDDGTVIGIGTLKNDDGPSCRIVSGSYITEVDGRRVTESNIGALMTYLATKAAEGKQVKLMVKSPNGVVDNDFDITCPLTVKQIPIGAVMQLQPNPTPQQLILRKAWIGQ